MNMFEHGTDNPGARPKPFITLDRIHLRTGGSTGFHGTTWRIHEGEHWVVVGRNGSGKSLLVGALGGRTLLVGGEIWYHFACSDPSQGYPLDGTVPEESIVYVSSEDQGDLASATATYHQARWDSLEDRPSLKVRAVLRGMTGRSWTAIREAAGQVGLEKLLDRHTGELSNGELRKLLLARALLLRPRLLVLDDPYAGLDVASRARLADVIDQLMAGTAGVILVTQRLEEIPARATHALLVEDKRVVAQGSREKVLSLPATRRLLREGEKTTRGTGLRPIPPKPPGKPVISLRNVRITYGKTKILDGIDWEVRAGERWLLAGPNGAGKSILLSLILGDNPQAYANDVSLFGRRRGMGESIWELKRKIGWVSPELLWHYDPDETTFEVVGAGFHDSAGLYRSLTRRQKERAMAWLARLELHEAAHAPLAGLSAGEKRLALLARALVKNPPLLLLDEPCLSLDRHHRNRFHTALAEVLAESDHTLIYVTHHVEEARPFTHHVLALDSGRVVQRD